MTCIYSLIINITMTHIITTITTITTIALLAHQVSSHGYLSQPPAVYYNDNTKTSYITRVNAYELFPSYRWDYSPDENAASYEHLVDIGGIQQPLKSFMDQYITNCPLNDLSTTFDMTDVSQVHWQNDQAHEGFVSSHSGPCEVWINNTIVFSDLNCAKHYTTYPAQLPVDMTICQGTCLLSIYWMALHESFWQLYKGCATIKNTKASANNETYSPATVATACFSPTTATPTPATPTPSTTNSSSANDTSSTNDAGSIVVNQITTNYINDGGLSLDSQGVSVSDQTITLSIAKAADGPRIYMLDSSGSNYQMFNLNNKKLEFDVDLTNVPCDYNLALYLTEMDYNSSIGSGYCDAQGFTAAPCGEMDIFEANIVAAHVTTHPCSNGSCDKDGSAQKIAFADSGFGPKMHIATSFKTENGVLVDVSQTITDTDGNTITLTISDTGANGGFASMGQSFSNGMVLVMSIWTAGSGGMEWLNGICGSYQTDRSNIYGSFANLQISDL
jgi:Glycosyl hydrolase family 7